MSTMEEVQEVGPELQALLDSGEWEDMAERFGDGKRVTLLLSKAGEKAMIGILRVSDSQELLIPAEAGKPAIDTFHHPANYVPEETAHEWWPSKASTH